MLNSLKGGVYIEVSRVPFGVPIIRIIVFWGPSWGPLFLGNYHIGDYIDNIGCSLGFRD